ncbi:interleukin-13 receptor subunit alpha-1 isoform X2 [Monodelphis domestica]|uniref:interleukin-13 receptor subunit alpha-1 isoform X2 n=1 Tax=Monodelphis domestica TaxID=13616 RepID=UPI00020F7899|nr:interleukin-13 receptor subunit alpha-1 isoform X2 [Monodelphis domestica]
MEGPVILCLLWAAGVLGTPATSSEIPTEAHPPPVINFSVSVKNLCTIYWIWSPPEGVNAKCELWYKSHLGEEKVLSNSMMVSKNNFRIEEVALNERICLQVTSQCNVESTNTSDPVEMCIEPPQGDPETAVKRLQCIWHNLSKMNCIWLPGKTAPPDTKYILHYWYNTLEKSLQCTNFYVEGQFNGCSFDLLEKDVSSSDKIQIMVTDTTGAIRPSYNIINLNNVKPDHPILTNLSLQNASLYVEWESPANFRSNCLVYQVEVNNSKSMEHKVHEPKSKCHISETPPEPEGNSKNKHCFVIHDVDPDAPYTVRVRAKASRFCFEDNDLWSAWSQKKHIGQNHDSKIHTITLLFIPVAISISTLLLLLYLKRLKIIIFPPIPDPGKIFKEMFGDQNDDTLQWKKYDIYEKQIKEETDSVVLVENLKRTSQ